MTEHDSTSRLAAAPAEARSPRPEARNELRRRLTTLMLFRVVLITLVLGATVALNVSAPDELAAPAQVVLFVLIALTYGLTLIYAYLLPRVANPLRFADLQIVGDLAITTVLVHVTGGAQSGYTFFYPLSIVAAAAVRYRRGALIVSVASAVLLVGVALLGWYRVLPSPPGVVPWEASPSTVLRQLVLNLGATVAIGVLAGLLGNQLEQSGARLMRSTEHAANLAIFHDNVLRCLSSGLVTVDREGRVVSANDAAGEILGREPTELAGRPVGEVLPSLAQLFASLPPDGSVRRGELTAVRPDGAALSLGISVSPLTDHRQEVIGRVVSFSDLTDLRRMETQVKRAERLAVVGGVAAAVAHEIRNPLASISGSIELLRSATHTSGDDRALMDIVLREVDRLNGLLGDLLDYTRTRERITIRVEIAPIIEETLRVFAQERSGVAARLVTAPGAASAWVDADPAQLRQVVWNLLRNAADAMPEGGEVVVTVGSSRGLAELVVADSGKGIQPEDQEHIFEPFFTTKKGGSGLGLAIVHRVITEHGGQVSVSSTPGRGTRVSVTLPVAVATEEAATAPS